MIRKEFWLRGVWCVALACAWMVVLPSEAASSFERDLAKAKAKGPAQQAQLLLFNYLDLHQNNASLFYEFGICTLEQKRAVEQTVPRALSLLGGLTDKAGPAQFMWAYGLYLQQLYEPEKRHALLEQASKILEGLLADPADPWQIRARGQCLLGRIRLAQGQSKEALVLLDKVLEVNALDLNHLAASLCRVATLDSLEQTEDADVAQMKLAGHPLVQRNLLLRLLLVDALHRRGGSYDPYFALLSDKKIRRQAEALAHYIHGRWVESITPGQDLSALPAAVVGAMGEQLRIAGQNMALDHDLGAGAQLQWAYRVNEALLNRLPGATSGVRTRAQFNRAMSLYYQDADDAKKAMAAALWLTQMAKENPSHSLAVTGISYAMELLRAQRQSVAYRQCAEVLFDQFATSEAADNERLAYAATVLIPQKQFARAIALLEMVPISHGTYFEAQRERLYCMTHDKSLSQMLEREAMRLCDEATRMKTRQSMDAMGHAKIILADLAMANKKWERALGWLDGFEKVYEAEDPLLLMKLQREGSILMQLDLLPSEATLAVSLAQSLLNGAALRNMSEEDLLEIKLVQAGALRTLGKLAEARVILESLIQQFDRDARVIHELAQTFFELGSEADMAEAGRYYQKLIEGLSAADPHYWNAWMRYLQICDRTGRHTHIIADRIRTLRASDPKLGGEPYQTELVRLSEKYSSP